jgi:hypothetical protein
MGTLPESERAAVEQHLAECRACALGQLAVSEALAVFGSTVEPVMPSTALRDRVLASTGGRSTGWSNGWRAIAGMTLFPVAAGPRLAGADVGLVRFAGGMTFPWHTHLGDGR